MKPTHILIPLDYYPEGIFERMFLNSFPSEFRINLDIEHVRKLAFKLINDWDALNKSCNYSDGIYDGYQQAIDDLLIKKI